LRGNLSGTLRVDARHEGEASADSCRRCAIRLRLVSIFTVTPFACGRSRVIEKPQCSSSLVCADDIDDDGLDIDPLFPSYL
jgi:hypothetical protein